MELVDKYLASLDEPKKEWVTSMVNFMREVFPDVKESLSNKIPTYNGEGYFIAFAAQKNYFTFHTDDMMDACKEIVDHHKSMQSPRVSDIKALKKWSKVPLNVQALLVGNVFCSKCGVTTIVDYGIHEDRFGVVLNGFCQKCGGRVARIVEDC
ncbi:DUF1801 domain-containing protein [Fusibacter sp. 3D3]|uniref:DUF1801 domain-containing protein n=1 Tax=Fusibacter sp. 3D3 TaxID=1048380 RepID=UPI00085816DC|nr:DUF1801 domain-containing protein [Fusibacter sp. 3D3]GAU76738.1 hypothetical protein F3D3_1335 [Fusibacter sp. 3D3]